MAGIPSLAAGLLAAALLLVSNPSWSDQQVNRRVAVTFDDLPVAGATDKSPHAQKLLTANLLKSVSTREIPVIGFVNEGKMYTNEAIDPTQVDLLNSWIDAGLTLGNHSYSHDDFNITPLEDFQADVLLGEKITKQLLDKKGAPLEYFRHPYLRTGTELAKRDAFEKFLADNDYKVAPVSIDNSEWIFAWAYDIALQKGDALLAKKIGADYIAYMAHMFGFYEDQSMQLFARNIDHVLLVHANKLNSDWFGVLADLIAAMGYTFITLDDALRDPAYDSPDRYVGSGGITWLHRWAITRNVDPAMFRGEPTTPHYILQLTGLAKQNDAENE